MSSCLTHSSSLSTTYNLLYLKTYSFSFFVFHCSSFRVKEKVAIFFALQILYSHICLVLGVCRRNAHFRIVYLRRFVHRMVCKKLYIYCFLFLLTTFIMCRGHKTTWPLYKVNTFPVKIYRSLSLRSCSRTRLLPTDLQVTYDNRQFFALRFTANKNHCRSSGILRITSYL